MESRQEKKQEQVQFPMSQMSIFCNWPSAFVLTEDPGISWSSGFGRSAFARVPEVKFSPEPIKQEEQQEQPASAYPDPKVKIQNGLLLSTDYSNRERVEKPQQSVPEEVEASTLKVKYYDPSEAPMITSYSVRNFQLSTGSRSQFHLKQQQINMEEFNLQYVSRVPVPDAQQQISVSYVEHFQEESDPFIIIKADDKNKKAQKAKVSHKRKFSAIRGIHSSLPYELAKREKKVVEIMKKQREEKRMIKRNLVKWEDDHRSSLRVIVKKTEKPPKQELTIASQREEISKRCQIPLWLWGQDRTHFQLEFKPKHDDLMKRMFNSSQGGIVEQK